MVAAAVTPRRPLPCECVRWMLSWPPPARKAARRRMLAMLHACRAHYCKRLGLRVTTACMELKQSTEAPHLTWRSVCARDPPSCAGTTQEAERAGFFLCGLARTLGEWQLALPAGPAAARRAAAAFVEFAALPAADGATCVCAPMSPAEKVRLGARGPIKAR